MLSPQPAPTDPSEQLTPQLAELASLFVRVLKLVGFKDLQIIQEVVRAAGREKPRALKAVAADLSYWARVLSRWATDPQFVTERGVPSDIPELGIGTTFESLVAKELPGEDPKHCLAVLLRSNSVVRLPNGLIRWKSRVARRSNRNVIVVDDILRPLRALLANLDANLTQSTEGVGPRYFERGVSGFAVTLDDVNRLCGMLETQGMLLLETVDAWLECRTKGQGQPRKRSGRLVRPYVGLFVSTDVS